MSWFILPQAVCVIGAAICFMASGRADEAREGRATRVYFGVGMLFMLGVCVFAAVGAK